MKTCIPRPKTTKKQYRIRNWQQYNKALVERGSLTVWMSAEALKNWSNTVKTGKRGRPVLYSNLAIQTMLTLQLLFRLPLRQTEGLLNSVLRLLTFELDAPDYSTLAKRTATLTVRLSRRASQEPKHIVIDSTGVKVFGEGEWKVRQHGVGKRRTWRKVHIGVDEHTGEILATKVTDNSVHDSEVLPELLNQTLDPVSRVSADGAYDTRRCYEAIAQRGARALIPPQHNARIWSHGNTAGPPHPRDENLRRIRAVGRRHWKRESGYHRRSLAETMMFRFKTIFGDRVLARTFAGQVTQLLMRSEILNRITALGMPMSYAVA